MVERSPIRAAVYSNTVREVRMTRPRPAAGALLAAGMLVAVGACSDVSNHTGPSEPATAPSLEPRVQQPSANDPVALAHGVRGFGGFFLDRAGAPTVYL